MQMQTRNWPMHLIAPRGGWFAAVLVAWGTAAAAATPPKAPAAVATPERHATSPFRQQRQSTKAQNFYLSRWGIEDLRVHSTNAGGLIRFSYRVVNPELAGALNDKRNTPQLYCERTRVALQVPVMDKVGALRQAMPPEAGKEYWMVFSNKGNFVKPGDRVDVQIGSFRADGLMVD